MKKTLITILATVLVCCCVVGGTLAWLTDKSETVTNTFTVGDIEITLTETTGDEYKMIPGNVLPKDPKVTVLANSEACWLFVQVTKSANFDTYLTFETANGWTKLADDGDNNASTTVYYRKVAATTADVPYYFLKAGTTTETANGCVTVIDTLTAAELEAAETTNPTLAFTAYAVQQENIGDDPATAWANAKTAVANP